MVTVLFASVWSELPLKTLTQPSVKSSRSPPRWGQQFDSHLRAKQQQQSKAQYPTQISDKSPVPAVQSLLGEQVKEAVCDYTSKPSKQPQNQISNIISLLAITMPPRR